ncbi:HNH endonuclease [Streptomyces sp. NPDC085946]|uniref:HNH endonuclease n=1 Tax=Streptomyces sp. NPDC085946 TaxID=3365744 RepID=UPI0037CFAB19
MARQPDREPAVPLSQLPRDDGHVPRARQAARQEGSGMSGGVRSSCERPTSEELRSAVAASISWAGLLRRLGRPDTDTQRALVRRWIAEEDLPTGHFLGQAHQRGKPGPVPARKPEEILVKHDGKRRTKTALLRRALSGCGVPEECAECGTGPEWLGRPMPLEVDHVNGDWSDDRRENLRLLCPNCHAVTRTWCRGGKRRPT